MKTNAAPPTPSNHAETNRTAKTDEASFLQQLMLYSFVISFPSFVWGHVTARLNNNKTPLQPHPKSTQDLGFKVLDVTHGGGEKIANMGHQTMCFSNIEHQTLTSLKRPLKYCPFVLHDI